MTKPKYDLGKLAEKAKEQLDNDPDLIIETQIEEDVRLLICRTGYDPNDYRVSLERQIETEDSDGNFDEECEQVTESDSGPTGIYEIIEAYIEEGGDPESI